MANESIKAYFVAAGQYHDIDYARLEILKLLAEHENIRTTVAADYHDIEGIKASDFLITYTCNLVPSAEEQAGLREYIASGKKWFALHGTNAILQFLEDGRVDTPETADDLMDLLGSQFKAHPPIHPYTVQNLDPTHPLVEGIGEFETDDELYMCKLHGDLHMLLGTRFGGKVEGWTASEWEEDGLHPAYYTKQTGDGEVLYLNLGHCRGHYDMQPMVPFYPEVERGSWQTDEYYELLRRGIRYCATGSAAA